ncbi:hypothetical protein EAX61_13805 [Dokdonia sinensis]|uniref:Uncharacterized protein n=1 Tax=Dokdonia sinensis TaxID=2479847 RepID=A0A3M0FVH2_9FLAO|nr:hypothetical protein [Dokdonia sinensis]RMB56671.1 hypothetical protein EAX61_13805 [Dokdonia sinensis]
MKTRSINKISNRILGILLLIFLLICFLKDFSQKEVEIFHYVAISLFILLYSAIPFYLIFLGFAIYDALKRIFKINALEFALTLALYIMFGLVVLLDPFNKMADFL